MAAPCYSIEIFNPDFLLLNLFENVSNVKDIRSKLLQGSLKSSFVKPHLILDQFQVFIAVNKALQSEKNRCMKTRNIYSEIVYNLSPAKNISEALKTVGIADEDLNILVIVLKRDAGDSVENLVNGTLVPFEYISKLVNKKVIQKLWKIPDQELSCSNLLDSVVTRIATKDI